jgi:hypothetical protein
MVWMVGQKNSFPSQVRRNGDVLGGPLGISIGTGNRRVLFVEKALSAVVRAIESGFSGETRGVVAFGSMPTPLICRRISR